MAVAWEKSGGGGPGKVNFGQAPWKLGNNADADEMATNNA